MTTPACFAPVAAQTGQPLALALQRLWLTGQILPAGARLTVEHIFRSAESQPLEVIYCFPLPRDAALRGFRISGPGFEARSQLRPTEDAVHAYEQGIARGSLSTLARQYGDGLINLTVGNIRPGEEIAVHLDLLAGVELRDTGFRFRFPFTLAPAYHPRARAAVVAGEGEIELPADEFGDVILPRFREDASALHQVGFDLSIASSLPIDELASPSHTVRVKRQGDNRQRVSLAAAKDVPDRDLVLDAEYRDAAPQVLAGGGRFAAVIPSTSFGSQSQSPRRLVILLDRSGSMQGAPLKQASQAIDACLGALSASDSFGLAAFDNEVEVLDPHLLAGTRENRDRAHAFLAAVSARGGTELARGFRRAVALLAGGGGDVLIFTDGQVSGTEEILAAARQTQTRLHCLGLGSASQDRFLALLARETGGVSRFVTPNERVDLPAVDLFASIGRPVASGLKTSARVAPAPPPSVFAGTPVLLFGEAAEGDALELAWDGGGSLRLSLADAAPDAAETIRLLQGARLITDCESRYPAAEALAPLAKRQHSRVAARLRELSETYGLASREMSLVAVVERAGDRPGELPETRVVPVGMPQDTRFQAYFPAPQSAAIACAAAPPPPVPPSPVAAASGWHFGNFSLFRERAAPAAPSSAPPDSAEDSLLALAAALDSDGGMPGRDRRARASASLVALLSFLQHGHTPAQGAFRSHAARLVAFLESLTGLDPQDTRIVAAVLAAVRQGRCPPGDWLKLARSSGNPWSALAKALPA